MLEIAYSAPSSRSTNKAPTPRGDLPVQGGNDRCPADPSIPSAGEDFRGARMRAGLPTEQAAPLPKGSRRSLRYVGPIAAVLQRKPRICRRGSVQSSFAHADIRDHPRRSVRNESARGGNFSVEHRELPGLSRTRPAFKQSGQPWTHRRSASGRAMTGTNAAERTSHACSTSARNGLTLREAYPVE
jgi:hypothetical protein